MSCRGHKAVKKILHDDFVLICMSPGRQAHSQYAVISAGEIIINAFKVSQSKAFFIPFASPGPVVSWAHISLNTPDEMTRNNSRSEYTVEDDLYIFTTL